MSQSELSEDPAERPRPRRASSIGAGAVVIHDGRVLLVRNVRGVTRGRCLLPAGRAEPDELPDHTAVREAFDETNLPGYSYGLRLSISSVASLPEPSSWGALPRGGPVTRLSRTNRRWLSSNVMIASYAR
jgi:8-oxo-dGTP pyrophosphatase MutT (NUDIX family)